jgi:glycosyltransferase involved in cell wall biosynthesis
MSIQPASSVAVIIPCYKQAHFLPEAVASVVAQTYPLWEAIIVDDGSPDDTAAVAERLIAAHPQHTIRLIRQHNQGLSASRNNAIQATQCAYILPLDADDMLEPEMLAETVAMLQAHPEVGFVYTDVHLFGEETARWSGGAYSLSKLRFDCPLMAMTLFRRAGWVAAGGFRDKMAPAGYEDWDFWLGLAECGWQGLHVPRSLVHYRRIAGSMLAGVRLHDMEMRAQLILNHARLYEPQFVAWAQRTRAPAFAADGYVLNGLHWLRAFVGYTALIALYHPHLLPKTLVRPLFCRLPVRGQAYARRLARLLRQTQAAQRA